MKSEKILTDDVLIRCEVCLKSQRISSLSNYGKVRVTGIREPLAATNKHMRNYSSPKIVGKPSEELYCFTCGC